MNSKEERKTLETFVPITSKNSTSFLGETFVAFCTNYLKVPSNENRGASRLVSIDPFDKVSCRQHSLAIWID